MKKNKAFRKITVFFMVMALLLSVINAGSIWPLSVSSVYAADDGGLSKHVVNTVSPPHVKLNLFDYWLDTRDAPFNVPRPQGGINQGHAFVFGGQVNWGPWNVWTGNEKHYNAQPQNENIRYGIYPGIVDNVLKDGYPVLDISTDNGGQSWVQQHGVENKLNESLSYLFDPDIQNNYKAVYKNVQGLLKYDGNGGYIYNSHENYAAFKETSVTTGANGELSNGYFDVYDNWALHGVSAPGGQFFPFDGAEEVFVKNGDGSFKEDENGHLIPNDTTPAVSSENLNHFMGLTMDTVFLQPEGGKIDADTPMYFTFSGDDDVWVFIDDVLVSDIGGVHDECFTVIDFETGLVYTGLTPVVKNSEGTFSAAIPTLQELRNAEESGRQWRWYDRINRIMTTGTYEQYVSAHDIKSKSLREIFTDAGHADSQAWGGEESDMSPNTFDQNTQHELKMFYLERGAGSSNLVLSFNMLAVPASGITKTDQDGRPVQGAEFALWPAKVSEDKKDQYGHPAPVTDEESGLFVADKTANGGKPICVAETDENGYLSFITDNRKIISFQERAQNGNFYYVLEETKRPLGYRSKGDISLYYSIYNPDNNAEGVLLSHNYWKTGAYTQAKLDVTMTDALYKYELDENGIPLAREQITPYSGASDNEIEEYLDNGIIFAVPIKRMDMDESLYDETNFHAIYGTTNTGWTMMTEDISDKKTVLEAAKEMESLIRDTRQAGTIIAERNARKLFHLEITNIPGDVKLTYPYLMGTDRADDSQYNIAFYFAPDAEKLDDITDPGSIVRLASATPGGDTFERSYASQFYVSNTFNRVRVQKLDYYGERMAGAEFSMYQTYSTQKRNDYYIKVDEGSIDESHVGMYRNSVIVNEDGTLKDREEIIKTPAWDSGQTKSGGNAGYGSLNLDGAFIFPSAFDTYIFSDAHLNENYKIDPDDTSTYMEEGEYVIFETKAPSEGYVVNRTPISVTVNDNGVFADAGEINDGVRVGKYAGWVLNSMSQFATEGAVDGTLTFLSNTLKVWDKNGGLKSPVEGDITYLNKYSNENDRYIFLAQDLGQYITDGSNLYQFTDEGTPQLLVRQNSNVNVKVILFTGEYAGWDSTVTVNKRNPDGTIYPLQGIATKGTLGFWLAKGSNGSTEGQMLDSIEIEGKVLSEGRDYQVYTPKVSDLSADEDISRLFSIETLVQVQDQSVGNLQISKNTEKVASGSASDEEVFLYRIYGVYEHATRIVLAETDENGDVKLNADGTPVLNRDFNGTLNVRLRNDIEGQSFQKTATDVSVDFNNGVGLIYLEPSYRVEHIYTPENEDHPAYGLSGMVETKITLDDAETGKGVETGTHITFDTSHSHEIMFEDGIGIFYHTPDFVIEKVSINGKDYYADPSGGQKGLKATTRFNYANIEQVQNLSVDSKAKITFIEENGSLSSDDRILTKAENGNVTVVPEEDGSYMIEYNLPSETYQQAVMGQFALHGGQSALIEDLAGGTVYYVYEYAAGNGGEEGESKLSDCWKTEINITPEGANGSSQIINPYEAIINNDVTKGRAARGIIRNNATQKVEFVNTGRVGALTVSKSVSGDQATDDDRKKQFSFTVTLKDSDGAPLKGTYQYTGKGSGEISPPKNGTITLDDDGSADITLMHGQSITIEDIPKDSLYEVSESNSEGFTVIADNDIDGDGIIEGKIKEDETETAEFVNMRLSTLAFTKVAAKDHDVKLMDAEFKLFQLTCTDSSHDHSQIIDPQVNSPCWTLISKQTSNEEGNVEFQKLNRNKIYRLIETKAPDGYVLPEGQWSVTTDDDNEIKIEAVGAEDGRLPTAFAADKTTGKLLLPNTQPIDIPSSGGQSVFFLIGGGLMMLMAAILFIVRKLYHKNTVSK